jgi:fibronectin-binding autotransporter adhesin
MSKKLNLPLALGIFLVGIFSVPSSSKAVTYYWDTTAGVNGTGGSGTFTASGTTWSTDPLGSAGLVANTGTTNDIANFQGTAGTVTFNNNLTQGAFNINTNNYTLTTGVSAARKLTSSTVTLGNNVNLNVSSFSSGALTFINSTISGGTGSSITLVSDGTGKRAMTLEGATVASSAPIIFNITGALASTNYLALGGTANSSTVNSTITGNSGTNNMTFYSSGTTLALNGAVSGSQGVSIGGNGLTVSGRVELNASNSYAGKTTLNGGSVYVSNNSSFSTNSIVVASNTIIRGVGVLTTNQFLNDVEFVTSGANLNIGSSANDNAIAFNGLISGIGSVTAGAKAQANATAMLMGTNNTFTGGVFANNGNTLYVGNLGNKADSQSSIGTGATITLGSPTTNLIGGLRWAKASGGETSDKDFVIAGNAAILASGANNANLTLNGAINFTNATNKMITFAGYNSNTLTISSSLDEVAGTTNSFTIGASSSGTVVLANTNNSFSGGVTITNATSAQNTVLSVAKIGNAGENSALGKNGTINVGSSSSGASTALKYTGTGETSDKVINFASATGGLTLEQSGLGNLRLTNAFTASVAGAKKIDLAGSSVGTGELGGGISDLGGVTSLSKSGTGTWKLSGTNSYSGTTEFKAAGVLQVASTNSLSKNSSLLGASSSDNTGTLNLLSSGDYIMNSYGVTNTGGFNMRFTNSSGSATTLRFTNANNYVTIATNTSAGRSLLNQSSDLDVRFDGNLEIGSTTLNQKALEFAGPGNFRIDGAVMNSGSAVRGLVKLGDGTLTLAGTNNNYNGATAVDAGTLLLTNSANLTGSTALTVSTSNTVSSSSATRTAAATLNVASGSSLLSGSTTTVYSGGNLIVNGTAGAVVVQTNGLLGGSGTVGTTTVAGILTPGNSPGVLNVNGNLTMASGGNMIWELFANTATQASPAVFDQVLVSGNLDFAGSNGINLNFGTTAAGSTVSWSDSFWNSNQSFLIYDVAGNTTGFSNLSLLNTSFNDATGAALAETRGSFSVSQLGNDVFLNYNAIPEPSTGSMLGLGFAGLVVTRLLRRKIS